MPALTWPCRLSARLSSVVTRLLTRRLEVNSVPPFQRSAKVMRSSLNCTTRDVSSSTEATYDCIPYTSPIITAIKPMTMAHSLRPTEISLKFMLLPKGF